MPPTLRKNEELEAFRDISGDVDESEFVPFASLFNDHTAITKNGELLQTIRITGLSYENIRQETMELRRTLREAIRSHVPNDSFAIWFHTIRLETDLSAPGEVKAGFAQELNDAWIEKNHFKRQYTNEVYITLVHEGQDAAILSPQVFLRGLLPSADLKWRNHFLDSIHDKLNAVVDGILESLKPFGAERLGIYKQDGVYQSDLLRFLNKIINFIDQPMPVRDADLSHYLTSGEITFAYNAMEVRTDDGRRRFATILTLKEYKEKSLPYIDRFLKLPMEFMVTQCVSFLRPQDALTEYKTLKKRNELGDERDLPRLSELDEILASDTGKITDFGEQQLTLFIIADGVRQLERNLRHAVSFLSKHGIITFREDLKFEECYWAQLPGNFEFVARMQPTSSLHIAGFANLYNHPVGLRENNHWGSALTTFHTVSGAPYFFNFHVGDNGHTTVVGQPGTGKATLINFLVAQATKIDPRIFYFDATNRHEAFIEKLGGESHVFTADGNAPPVPLNPFSLAANEGNGRFLTRWVTVLMRCTGQALEEADKTAINESFAGLYKSGQPRSFSRYLDLMAAAYPQTAAKLSAWRKGGIYGHLFDHEQDVFDMPGRIHGFHLSQIFDNPVLAPPLMSYLLQKSTVMLDGRPAIFVLDEGWQLIARTHIAAELAPWLDYLKSKNAMTLFSTQHIDDAGTKPFTPALMEKIATQVYFPDPDPDEIYMEGFGLNELEFSYLDVIESQQHHFLLKRMENTIIAEFNMDGLEQMAHILTGEEAENRHAA